MHYVAGEALQQEYSLILKMRLLMSSVALGQ
jgi:hypothetical protein